MIYTLKTYLNSLPDDTKRINISGRNLTELPDLSRFRFLKYLYCDDNRLECMRCRVTYFESTVFSKTGDTVFFLIFDVYASSFYDLLSYVFFVEGEGGVFLHTKRP